MLAPRLAIPGREDRRELGQGRRDKRMIWTTNTGIDGDSPGQFAVCIGIVAKPDIGLREDR